MLIVYTLSNCDTCRKATKWLREKSVVFEERAIRETPPSTAELRRALVAHDGDLRRLFNTSGLDYRQQKIGEKLPSLTVPAALALLTGNGNLVKRPFLIGDGVVLVGFDSDVWSTALEKS